MIVDPTLSAALRHWGARSVPFSDSPGEAPFAHASWEQARLLLQQTAALRSLMLLCGDNGTGKSALLAHWIQNLEPKAYLPLVITQATLSGNGLLAVLLNKLGQKTSLFRSRNLGRLEEAIKDIGRLTPVLVLDEAQNYIAGALEEIRLLLGLNLPRQPVFALILLGDLYLQDTLRLHHHKALYSRIAARAELVALEHAQTEPYLVHGLRQVGLNRPCFDPAAIDLLASASQGVPRMLNLLARHAWIAAAQAQNTTIGPDHVRLALNLVPAAADRIHT